MGSDKLGRRVRRQFTDDFKAGAVRLVFDEGKTVGAVARELDLTPSALGVWVRHAQADRTKGRTGLRPKSAPSSRNCARTIASCVWSATS